ncbi:hypothetical protein MPSEU_000984100 [Mayamaea pseudoterrestris]|nr:hypothetical protein MPSEU_000984100 [Mayamaea pseudoterrestris]
MPPPPPPSKSYLWKFDDYDSEIDSDDDNINSSSSLTTKTVATTVHSPPTLLESPSNSSSSSNDDHDDEDDDQDEQQPHATPPTSTSAKRRQRRKNKRTKRAVESTQQRNCSLSFGNVTVKSMDRCLGVDGVPASGSWPLGLNDEVLEISNVSVDDYEQAKQERLQERLAQLKVDDDDDDSATSPIHTNGSSTRVLETRQWDYRSSNHKNPLFGSLTENLRRQLFLNYSSAEHDEDGDGHDAVLQPQLSGSPPRLAPRKHRARSGSFSSSGEVINSTRRTRPTAPHSTTEQQFNETFTQLDVNAVRNQLEELRNSRSQRAGCNCRKLVVHVGSSLGTSKKAQAKRLNINDLKKELRKRHLLPHESAPSREELETILHQAVQNEPCCHADCFCVRNNINCQMDACDCWLPSHQLQLPHNGNRKAQQHSFGELSSQEIEAACGNRYGMYATNFDQIQKHRAMFMSGSTFMKETQFCQEVTP